MSQGKCGISSYRVSKVLDRSFCRGGIAGCAQPIAAHEFRISQRVTAVTRSTLGYQRSRRSVENAGDLLSDVALQIGQAGYIEVAFLSPAPALRILVKKFQGEMPSPFYHLDGAMEQESGTQAHSDLRRRRFGRHRQYCGGREHV